MIKRAKQKNNSEFCDFPYIFLYTVRPIKNVFCLRAYCGSMINRKKRIPSILASIYIEIWLFEKDSESIAFLHYFLDLKMIQNSIYTELLTNFFWKKYFIFFHFYINYTEILIKRVHGYENSSKTLAKWTIFCFYAK